MILEAFSQHLKTKIAPMTDAHVAALLASNRGQVQARPRRGLGSHVSSHHSRAVLRDWLITMLQTPAENLVADIPLHERNVMNVIQAELMLVYWQGDASIEPASASGSRLLRTLEDYCDSYDHWQFGRFLHQVNASDFS